MKKEETKAIDDGMYCINGKRFLYYQDGEWFKPVYLQGRYTGNIMPLDKQPKIIKSLEKINSSF